MKRENIKRLSVVSLSICLLLTVTFGCKQTGADQKQTQPSQSQQTGTPKYIFLFIGDGMSYAQVQAAALYLGSKQGGIGTKHLSFMDFPATGVIETHDAFSYIPDSASAGTAIATGHNTESSKIGMDTTGKIRYKTIAERLKEEKGYKIGIVSTVYLNHATPAAFYAHQTSRNMYYEIGLDMIQSGFDFFGGGGLNNVDNGGKSENLYTLAQAAGYKVLNTVASPDSLKRTDGKAIVVPPELDEETVTVPYRIDAADSDWSLADYVQKGIEMLDGGNGFFMMVESGKIDWACHANDSNAAVSEVLALDESVKVALDFYQKHPAETLILVTADHETGGMSLGYAGMEYTFRPQYLQAQTMSFTRFNDTYIVSYKKNKPLFESVLKDIEKVFGIIAPLNATGTSDTNLVMSDSEVQQLKAAYELTLKNKSSLANYGSYEPLTITANKILNHHIGVGFSSYGHTAVSLPVYAVGAGAQQFSGVYQNTGIFLQLLKTLNMSANP